MVYLVFVDEGNRRRFDMSFKKGSKVVLKANAAEMDIRFKSELDKLMDGVIYTVLIKKDDAAILDVNGNILDSVIVDIKALRWAA